MEKFKVVIKQKSFSAAAENIGANDLRDLANNIAEFCKRTVILHNKLKDAKVLSQTTRIKVGQTATLEITYLADDLSLNVSLRNFGRFVNDSTTEQITDAIFEIADYQQTIGYLFNVAK